MAAPRKTSPPDYVFITLTIFLTVFGLVMLSSASSDLGRADFGDSYYYLTHQILYGLIPGIVGFALGAFLYYRHLEKIAVPLLALSIVLLLLIFTPLGFSANGSNRWLDFGFFTFQPSELLKLSFFIYLGAWISRSKARSKSFTEGFLPLLIILGVIMGILFLQPSTTVAVLIFVAAILTYFTAGAPLKYLFVAGVAAVIALAAVIAVTPYRLARVTTFVSSVVGTTVADEQDAGYHITKSLIAIGSGGVTGVGFGQSTSKLYGLPEPIGDSIFAVIAEELGFVGGMVFILLMIAFLWRGLRIARRAPDAFARLMATGFMCVIGLQAFVNIGAISGALPLTGVPLPFVSYGGTALAVFLTMAGITVNISRYQRA